MLLMNKLTSSFSSFNLNNKRNRTPSMESIAPLLRRIKKSLFNHNHQTPIKEQNEHIRPVRRSNTVHCNSSRKQNLFTGDDNDQRPVLLNTSDIKYYALRPERTMNDQTYAKPVENWWSSSPPAQQSNQHRSIMTC